MLNMVAFSNNFTNFFKVLKLFFYPFETQRIFLDSPFHINILDPTFNG